MQPVLTPQERDAATRLNFFARGVVEGLNVGRHRSPHPGTSLEFMEHRPYVRGDEIRSIDWKLFGKTDRLFIRQYEEETNLRAILLLDQSGSMAYRGQRSMVSKHEFAVKLTAALATLFIYQQDSVGLVTFDSQPRVHIPPRSQPRHLLSLMHCLTQSTPAGETSLGGALRQLGPKFRKRGLLVLVSDCLDHPEQLMPALSSFRHAGHEVIVFQIWDQDEIDFPFRGRTEFRSLENRSTKLLDPDAMRRSYLTKVAEFQSQLDKLTAKERIQHIACASHEDCGEVLRRLLEPRLRGKSPLESPR